MLAAFGKSEGQLLIVVMPHILLMRSIQAQPFGILYGTRRRN
ncbi:hypothetical protein WG8_0227, partial [Paenibacillus sp. Aloe-11]